MLQSKKATRKYHKDFYQDAKLFEKGSWLEQSEGLLLDMATEYFGTKKNVRVLDLGCGVGRNTIPIAKIIKPNGGRVTGIDFLDIAIEKLLENAKKYGVLDVIDAQVQDIENYQIESANFDLIIAYSVLEHGVSNEKEFFKIIESIKQGTKKNGVNYLGITTNLQELDEETLERLPEDIEFKATYEQARNILSSIYKGWDIIHQEKTPYEEKYMKNGRMIIWRNDFLTFTAKKP